jgi:hypothetical protein
VCVANRQANNIRPYSPEEGYVGFPGTDEIGRSDAIGRGPELKSKCLSGRTAIDPPFGSRTDGSEDTDVGFTISIEIEH